MLNFIDGLWSACGGERIIIFTTNNNHKLDPALIRRGRMDKHIEMSYCRYEAFKVLASNYLQIEEHQFFELFGEIHSSCWRRSTCLRRMLPSTCSRREGIPTRVPQGSRGGSEECQGHQG